MYVSHDHPAGDRLHNSSARHNFDILTLILDFFLLFFLLVAISNAGASAADKNAEEASPLSSPANMMGGTVNAGYYRQGMPNIRVASFVWHALYFCLSQPGPLPISHGRPGTARGAYYSFAVRSFLVQVLSSPSWIHALPFHKMVSARTLGPAHF